jgi:hypothetical protein
MMVRGHTCKRVRHTPEIEHFLAEKPTIGEQSYPVNAKMIADDDPVPLKAAANLFFPAGGVTARTLQTEIRKGNLVPERIGGKYFITKRAINEMRERCRSQLKVPGFTSAGNVETGELSGISATGARRSQRDATRATANRLKKRSPTTSPENTRRQAAPVIPIR